MTRGDVVGDLGWPTATVRAADAGYEFVAMGRVEERGRTPSDLKPAVSATAANSRSRQRDSNPRPAVYKTAAVAPSENRPSATTSEQIARTLSFTPHDPKQSSNVAPLDGWGEIDRGRNVAALRHLSWAEAVAVFIAAKVAQGVSQSTIRAYLYALESPRIRQWRWECSIDCPADVTLLHVRRLMVSLGDLSAFSARQIFVSTRSWLRWLRDEGHTDADPRIFTVAAPKVPDKSPPHLTEDQYLALLDGCKIPRDRLMIETFVYTGIRLSEMSRLDLSDFVDEDYPFLLIRSGKGAKDRPVAVDTPKRRLSNDLRRWISEFRPRCHSPALFVTTAGHGHTGGDRLSPRSIHEIVQRAGARVGVRVHPHQLRHTAIFRAISAGMDALTVQRQAGHSSATVTARYYRLSGHEVAAAYMRRSD